MPTCSNFEAKFANRLAQSAVPLHICAGIYVVPLVPDFSWFWGALGSAKAAEVAKVAKVA